MAKVHQKVHVHHPALLRIAEVTSQGDKTILDNLSSLAEGRIESDVIFPLDCPATIRVTILTGKSYEYTIPVVIMPPPVYVEHLDDIGDVEVPSPGDQYHLAFDEATGLWIPKPPPLLHTGGTMAGDINMDGHKITNLPAPTLSHHAAPKGYVDQVVAPFDPFAQFLDIISWVSLDGFYLDGDGDYGADPCGHCLWFWTGSLEGNEVMLRPSDSLYKFQDTGQLITSEFLVYYLDYITDQAFWLRLADTDGIPISELTSHIGWKIIDSRIYASSANGVDATLSNTGIDLIADTQLVRLKLVFNPGTDLKFYVNGTLLATHDTNLPDLEHYKVCLHGKTLTDDMRDIVLGRVLLRKAYA